MSEAWRVCATLHETDTGLAVGLDAFRGQGDAAHSTSDRVVVTDEADARREARAFCAQLGVETYEFVDARLKAAS